MNPETTLYGDSGAGGAVAGLFGGLMGLVWLVVAVLMIVALWKIFTKAGKPGWYSLIPIWNTLVLLRIVGRPMWWFLLYFIPIVNVIILFIVLNDLSKSFGKGIGFTIGLIIFPYVFMLVLGLGSAPYVGPGGMAAVPTPAPPAYQPPAPPSA